MSIKNYVAKSLLSKKDKRRDDGLRTPSDIRRIDNIYYGPDKDWHLLDVYYPKASSGRLPVIVIIHGGGWVYGDKDLYQFYAMSLGQRGFAVVNPSYRLAPKDPFPKQLEDISSIIKWLLAADSSYQFDKNNIFLVGDSAGAHLASLYTSICTDPNYAANYDFQVPAGFRPRALALNCGVYDMLSAIASRPRFMQNLVKNFLDGRTSPERLELVNPCSYINKDYPPTFLMTSSGDYLIEQPKYMEKEFLFHNVEYISKIYSSADRVLPHIFHCNIKLKEAQICNDEECDFLHSQVV